MAHNSPQCKVCEVYSVHFVREKDGEWHCERCKFFWGLHESPESVERRAQEYIRTRALG